MRERAQHVVTRHQWYTLDINKHRREGGYNVTIRAQPKTFFFQVKIKMCFSRTMKFGCKWFFNIRGFKPVELEFWVPKC